MKILLTGGTGSVGKAAVARLVEHGHDVMVIGRRPNLQIPAARYAACDITDYPALRDHARGCQAIVHLAAIPNPSAGEGQEIFRVNAEGTFNVFQAATEAGIQRVVQASSINALGLHLDLRPASPHYFPMDEEHPCITTDAYSFSKTIIEEIGRYYWRREGYPVWRCGCLPYGVRITRNAWPRLERQCAKLWIDCWRYPRKSAGRWSTRW